MYSEEDMLMLSGIQHFVFCPRQWALIHIEQQWQDNRLTTEGSILHKNVDDPTKRKLNNDTITLRHVNIASKELGLYGISDAIELHPTLEPFNSIEHNKYKGHFIPHPVEYKRGKHKSSDCDIIQLVAQVMCLEEMYDITIKQASLFYWETRRRETIEITDQIRSNVKQYVYEMHRIYNIQQTPEPNYNPKCKSCSLNNLCLPKMNRRLEHYLKDSLS